MAGLYFEDCVPGLVIRHDTTRTITEMDNVLFSCLTLNTQPLHLDKEWAAGTTHGRQVVNGIFTLGLVTGMSAYEVAHGTSLGVLGFSEITYSKALHHGDTLRVETEVLGARESASRPDAGIVQLEHRGYNQRDELVIRVVKSCLHLKRDTPAVNSS